MEALASAHGLPTFGWASRYSTSRDDLIGSFYRPAMDRSVRYDRAVGFFRSSFFSIAGSPTASFALRGGTIRLLCSPELTVEDAAAIQRGLELRRVIDQAARRELERLLAYPLARPAVELLAALVAEGALETRFGVREDGRGIFHDKVGVFTDRHGNCLSFSGSVNETWHGWHPLGNHESFEVFASWVAADRPRVDDHVAYFEGLWEGRADGLAVYDAPYYSITEAISVSSERKRCDSEHIVRIKYVASRSADAGQQRPRRVHGSTASFLIRCEEP